jgi:exopolyphosphatase/guanosine-5'-triphosphate,3'-diphosphate pyrophosphatase
LVGTAVRVAAVDIGTNTVRLLIADVEPERLSPVARSVDVVGLGVGVDATGSISGAALDRLADVLVRYRATVAAGGADRIRAIATSAARDAANRDQLSAVVSSNLGIDLDVIDGEEEARLAFSGAAHGVGGSGPRLVIDPGGGSTEFVFGDRAPEYLVSVDIGSVRLTDRLLPSRPAAAAEIDAARDHVSELFAAVRLPAAPDIVIGVAGTYTSLAAIHLGSEVYQPDQVHQSVLTLDELDSLVQRLSRLTVEETEAIPSLDPARAPVILAGAVVAAEALRCARQDRITVSESDSLEGIVLDLSRV